MFLFYGLRGHTRHDGGRVLILLRVLWRGCRVWDRRASVPVACFSRGLWVVIATNCCQCRKSPSRDCCGQTPPVAGHSAVVAASWHMHLVRSSRHRFLDGALTAFFTEQSIGPAVFIAGVILAAASAFCLYGDELPVACHGVTPCACSHP